MDSQPHASPAPAPRPPPRPLRAQKKKAAPRRRVFVPVEIVEDEPFWDRSMLVGLLLALILLPSVGWIVFRVVPEAPAMLQQIVEFTLVEPPPPPEPEPEPTPVPKKKPKKVDMQQVDKPIPTQAAEEPVEEAKPVFGLSMTSTRDGPGDFQMRVGNTLMKEPEDEIVPPEDVKPLRTVSFSRLEEPPRIIKDYRAEYPEVPRSEGIEGTVVMYLTIDETGKVTAARVVRGVHPDLDSAAKAAAFRFRFRPGMSGGEPVITTNYSYRYTWLIDS